MTAIDIDVCELKLYGSIEKGNKAKIVVKVVTRIGHNLLDDFFIMSVSVKLIFSLHASYKIIELLTDVPDKTSNEIMLLIFKD